jgi:hypothetical protein
VVEVADGIVIQYVVRLVEGGPDLREVRRLDAKLGGEDVVVRIVEVIPHARVQRLDAPGEAIPEERVADLGPQVTKAEFVRLPGFRWNAS